MGSGAGAAAAGDDAAGAGDGMCLIKAVGDCEFKI